MKTIKCIQLFILLFLFPLLLSFQNHQANVGISIGYGSHFGKETEVDSITQASQKVPDDSFFHHTATLGLLGEVKLLRFYQQQIQLRLALDFSFPKQHYSLQILPQYKLLFSSFNLWLGVGTVFQYINTIDDKLHVSLSTSLGAELPLSSDYFLGLSLDMNLVNFHGVQYQKNIDNTLHDRTKRYNSIFLKCSLNKTF